MVSSIIACIAQNNIIGFRTVKMLFVPALILLSGFPSENSLGASAEERVAGMHSRYRAWA